MKRISFFAFTLVCATSISFTALSQEKPKTVVPVDPDSKMIMYREVVNELGNSGYLYDKAIEWFRSYYVNPTSVFSVQDRVNGKDNPQYSRKQGSK